MVKGIGLAFLASLGPHQVQEPGECAELRQSYAEARNLSATLKYWDSALFDLKSESISSGIDYYGLSKNMRKSFIDESVNHINGLVARVDYITVVREGDYSEIFRERCDREIDEAFDCLSNDDFLGASIRIFFMEVYINNYLEHLTNDGTCKKQ